MRFTVTPLGSAGGRSVGQVVDDIVRYLDGRKEPQLSGVTPPTRPEPDPSAYYSDGSAEPGRWLGNGAAEMGLVGAVHRQDFARVLAGRDPHTGVRLLTAQGSAGRRPTLARGTETRWGRDGEALYDMKDAAAALKLELGEVECLVAEGERLAFAAACSLLGASVAPGAPAFEGSYLLPTIEADGTRWIPERELQRCEAARAVGPDPETVAAGGEPDDVLSVVEAARLAGLSAQYLRSLCRRWERDREKIEGTLAGGGKRPRPVLTAHRGVKGQWLVKRGDLVEYLRHRTAPAVRVGFDLTLTTEKSLGVLALLGDADTRAAVLRAIQAGNDRGLASLEFSAAMARIQGQPVSTRGWTVASFRHLTSRALDPFPHHHNVVANTVVDPDGGRRALDARWLYRRVGEASALATAEMRYRLTSHLGVRWRRGRKGTWEIDGIPDEILREFSQRSNEVDEAVAELEALIGREATIEELRGVVTRTRPGKKQVDADDLVEEWWRRAEALGFTRQKLARCVRRADALAPESDAAAIFKRLTAPDGLCASSSIFTRADVIAALVNMDSPGPAASARPLLLPADQIEGLADRLLASDLVVELLPEPDRRIKRFAEEPLFTTTEMLAVQARMLTRFRAGMGTTAAAIGEDGLAAALAEHQALSSEQRAFVRSLCTSGHRVQCAIGRAGSGKTTAMRAAAAAWTAGGYRVLGTAVKGEAARHLGAEAGIPSETLAWHLAHTDPATSPLDARTVLIVDEASTVSDRDLDRLAWLSEATGAAIRLVGDPAQHGAVGAGGMFKVLCEQGGADTPELRTSHRVVDPHDRNAADALREGRVSDALSELEAAGHLHVVTDEVDLYLDVLQRWWQSRRAGAEHPMVDRRNYTRWQLNRLAHRLLQVNGEIESDEVVAARDRRFSVGDRVVARKGDRTLHPPSRPHDYVRNGATGTVVAIRKHENHTRDAIRVDFAGIGEVDLPRAFFDEHRHGHGRLDVGLDHAYAVTSYAVQGATFGESTSRIDENASLPETYVDITRGRSANHLYLTRGVDVLDGERLPRAPNPPIVDAVAMRLKGSGAERAAIDVDPGAGDGGLDGSQVQRAAALRARQAARRGSRHLDPSMVEKLPPRSDVPFLARQWDETVAHLNVYLARWNASPGGNGLWAWALGPPSHDAQMEEARRRTASAIVDLCVQTVRESLRNVGGDLPSWARAHLAQHAAAGRCRHDPVHLGSLYERIDQYRAQATTDTGSDHASAVEFIFGTPPDDPHLRMRRLALIGEAMPPDSPARVPAMARGGNP